MATNSFARMSNSHCEVSHDITGPSISKKYRSKKNSKSFCKEHDEEVPSYIQQVPFAKIRTQDLLAKFSVEAAVHNRFVRLLANTWLV